LFCQSAFCRAFLNCFKILIIQLKGAHSMPLFYMFQNFEKYEMGSTTSILPLE
jgi:hypothetical protein